jgi:hypothetical protein
MPDGPTVAGGAGGAGGVGGIGAFGVEDVGSCGVSCEESDPDWAWESAGYTQIMRTVIAKRSVAAVICHREGIREVPKP